MRIHETPLAGLRIVELRVHRDGRGYFLETWHARRYQESLGFAAPFVQHNQSFSSHRVLRGLHYQLRQGQGKLVRVVQGRVFDVAVDLRRSSSTFGQWFGIELSGIDACVPTDGCGQKERENDAGGPEAHQQLWIPPGFAHGFQVLSDHALVEYLCNDFYAPGDEYCLAWDDPDVGIDWPLVQPVLSERDAHGMRLRELQVAGALPG